MMELNSLLNPSQPARAATEAEISHVETSQSPAHVESRIDSPATDVRVANKIWLCYFPGCSNNDGKGYTRKLTAQKHYEKLHGGECDPLKFTWRPKADGAAANQKSQTPVSQDRRASTQTKLTPPVSNLQESQTEPIVRNEPIHSDALISAVNEQTLSGIESTRPSSPPILSPELVKTEPKIDTNASIEAPLEEEPIQDDDEDAGTPSTDDGVYCTCRGPDDHTWMISCNACDEWFHGRCVGMSQELDDIIERYICPDCEKKGQGRTTYRALCSHEGCLKAAKMPSKYCSDECRYKQVTLMLSKASVAKPGDLPTRGGTLTLNDLKAAVLWSNGDAKKFQTLGQTPPPTRNGTATKVVRPGDPTAAAAAVDDVLFDRRLDLVEMTKKRAVAAQICGYDTRLSWSVQQFAEALGKGMVLEEPGEICQGKKKCNKHVDWAKMAVKEVQFERDQARKGMKAF